MNKLQMRKYIHVLVSAVILLTATPTWANDDTRPVPPQILAAAKLDPALAQEFEKGIAQWQAVIQSRETERGNPKSDRESPWTNVIDLWEQLVATAKTKRGPDDIFSRLGEFYLGDSYRRDKSYLKAIPLLKRAIQASEELIGPDHFYTAGAMESLAEAYSQSGFFDLAQPLAEKALAKKIAFYREPHDDIAVSQLYLAGIYSELDAHEQALALGTKAAVHLKKSLGSDSRQFVIAQNLIGLENFHLGRFEEAIGIQEQVLQSSMRQCGEICMPTLIALLNLASSYSALGQYDKSSPLKLRASTAAHDLYGSAHPNYISTLNSAALELSELGKQELAIQMLESALSNSRYQESNSPQRSLLLRNLSQLYVSTTDYQKAAKSATEALDIATNQRNLRDAMAARSVYASIYRWTGNQKEAIRIQEDIVSYYRSYFGEIHSTTANAQLSLGLSYALAGDLEKAIETKWEALATLSLLYPKGHPSLASGLVMLSVDLHRIGEQDTAISVLKASVNMYQATRSAVSRLGREWLDSYTSTVQVSYQKLAEWLVDASRFDEAQLVLDMLKEEEQFSFVRRDAATGASRKRIGFTEKEREPMNRYSKLSEELFVLAKEASLIRSKEKLGLSDAQISRMKFLDSQLLIAQSEFKHLLLQLREDLRAKGRSGSAAASEIDASNISNLQDLIASLGNDVILLRYYVTEESVGVLMTGPNAQKGFNTRIGSKELRKQILELRAVLQNPKSDPLPAAQALYNVLLRPLEADLQLVGARTVMLSLDGVLRRVPFGALHDGQTFAALRWNFPIYTSVVRERLRYANRPQWRAAGLGLTRAIGDFKALPSVKAEIYSVVKSRGTPGVFEGSIYLDDAFDAPQLREVGRQPFELMHIASHFQLSPGTEINSFLLLGDGNRLTLGDIRTQNYRFDNVDLLTLSACDTGVGGGWDDNGKEIEGFGVITQQQGAKAVLATLWPVADQSTSFLMTDMYRRRQSQGLSKIEALRQAQLSTMAQPKYAHPFYWAPFIMMGNWK